MGHPIPRPLIRAHRIRGRVQQLGRTLAGTYRGRDPLVVVLMDGAAVFAADLLRAVPMPGLRVHFMRASSYHGGTRSSGSVELSGLPACDDEEVLVVDDICDSGHTLARLQGALLGAGAARVRSCVLLDKPARREADVVADWVGFTVPDRFLVGYGLDHQERWRHLPDVCTLD